MVRKMTVTLLIICFSIASFSLVADAKIPDDVEKAAVEGLSSIKGTLSNEKTHYGLSETDDVSNSTTLGNGFEYYRISINEAKNINEKKQEPSLSKLLVPSGKYIYTVKVNNKPCAIIFVEKQGGKWTVVGGASYPSFEEDINNVKKNYKSSNIEFDFNNDDEKIIYDDYLGIYGVAKKGKDGKDYILHIKENEYSEIAQNDVNDVMSATGKIMKLHKIRSSSNLEAGGPSSTQENNNLSIYTIIAVLLIISILLIFIFKRRLVKHN